MRNKTRLNVCELVWREISDEGICIYTNSFAERQRENDRRQFRDRKCSTLGSNLRPPFLSDNKRWTESVFLWTSFIENLDQMFRYYSVFFLLNERFEWRWKSKRWRFDRKRTTKILMNRRKVMLSQLVERCLKKLLYDRRGKNPLRNIVVDLQSVKKIVSRFSSPTFIVNLHRMIENPDLLNLSITSIAQHQVE